jgi:hypothetical protein
MIWGQNYSAMESHYKCKSFKTLGQGMGWYSLVISLVYGQGDQIGQFFAKWATFGGSERMK